MKKRIQRTCAIAGVIVCFFLFQGPHPSLAKDPEYPIKPINFYIPYSAGGTTDLACRALINSAAKFLEQPFVPINRAGAGGSLGAMSVINAKPDGYTLGGMTTSNTFVGPHSEESLYRDLSGFTMIMNFGTYIWPAVVRSDAPWKTWKDFMEYAQRNPKAVKIGLTGAKSVTINGLIMWMVEQKINMDFTFIPFKGSAEIVAATMGGHITAACTVADPTMGEYLKTGKMRVLFYQSAAKIPGYEDVPSIKELYGIEVPSVAGVVGPKGLPDYVMKKLDGAFAKAVKDPEFVSLLNQMYLPVHYMNSADYRKYVNEWFPKMGEIIKTVKAQEAKEKK